MRNPHSHPAHRNPKEADLRSPEADRAYEDMLVERLEAGLPMPKADLREARAIRRTRQFLKELEV